MGADEIPVSVTLPAQLDCQIGAYITYNGWRYTINTIPSPTVTGGAAGLEYTYKINFESPVYRMYDKGFKHLNNKTFTFTGDLSALAFLVVSNINEIDSGWSVGVIDDLGVKTVEFDKHTCRTALDTVAESFTCEWYMSGADGKTLNFVKLAGNLTSLVFQYGRGKGLYSLGYEYQNDKNIVTRAFGYGSSRNLPKNYRNGATQLMFDGLYLENNTDLYRVREGDYTNEDIYPSIDGHVSAVSAYDATANTFTITDSSLTFNLNTYFSPDTPKVGFTSGQLMGQEFEIVSYDNASKVIKLKTATDAAGNVLPSSVVRPVVGDTYTLFDMYLPDEVVTAAENKLKAATLEWLLENSVPRVLYSLELDPLYARDNGIMLKPGDQIRVQDTALGIDALIRVTGVTYPVNFPAVITPDTKITATIANFIPYTRQERIIADTIDNQHEIKIVNRTNAERARLNALNLKKLQGRIFNPDGTLFTGVDSLVAGMATFGYDSQNFNLNNVMIAANFGGDPNYFAISGGDLVHYTFKIEGLGYTWHIDPNAWAALDPAKFYYVYAKCSKTSLSGVWQISETPVSVNDIAGYYAFNLGILYEVNDKGYRTFQSTKGVTYIVGDTITTGTITSIDGQTYFNLNTGEIGGKIKFLGGSSGYNNLTDKPDLSGIATAQSAAATALANANNAQSTADRAAQVTDGLFTIIDGNLITTGTLQAGDATHVNAGLTGVTDLAENSVRLWAGEVFANRNTAPFRVTNAGKLFASNADISGKITASSGKIGNFNITNEGLSNTDGSDAFIQQIHTFPDGHTASLKVGLQAGDAGDGYALAVFLNDKVGDISNRAIVARASGATTQNQAITCIGDFVQPSGRMVMPAGIGQSFIQVYKGADGDNYFTEFSNGVAIRFGKGTG
jgi:hypothetical protein